jgi:hypothetical protein
VRSRALVGAAEPLGLVGDQPMASIDDDLLTESVAA